VVFFFFRFSLFSRRPSSSHHLPSFSIRQPSSGDSCAHRFALGGASVQVSFRRGLNRAADGADHENTESFCRWPSPVRGHRHSPKDELTRQSPPEEDSTQSACLHVLLLRPLHEHAQKLEAARDTNVGLLRRLPNLTLPRMNAKNPSTPSESPFGISLKLINSRREKTGSMSPKLSRRQTSPAG
jgi:hypothetical protein